MSSADLCFHSSFLSLSLLRSYDFIAELATQLMLAKEEILRVEKELDEERKAHQKADDELQRKCPISYEPIYISCSLVCNVDRVLQLSGEIPRCS